MNIQRITISLPKHLHQELIAVSNKRKVSQFIAEAIETKLLENKTASDPITEFIKLRGKLPRFSHKEIMTAIHKGRQ